MQDCFREHPDVYGAELEDTEGEPPQLGDEQAPTAPETSQPEGAPAPSLANMESGKGAKVAEQNANREADRPDVVAGKRERAQAATQQVKSDHQPTSESEEMVPKAWHDSR